MFTSNGKPIYPVPEAISRPDVEGAYEIVEGYASSTDLSKARMVIRTGGACVECGEDHARASRLHEIGHTAWTPADWETRVKRTKDKLPLELVNGCEDARINARRMRAGVDMPSLLCEKEGEHYYIIKQFTRSGDMMALAGLFAASFASGDAEPVKRAVEKLLGEMRAKVDEVEVLKANAIEELYKNVIVHTRYHMNSWRNPTFRYSLTLARDIIRILNGVATKLASEIEDAKLSKEKVKAKVFGKGKKPQPIDVNFGEMTVIQLPMPYRSKAGFERRWTARDEGDIPTRFDRWSIDKRVFRAKKRTKGAAVLVDVSGSMSWKDEDLARVLDEVPAATIAIYSGSGGEGQLVIVAKKGRCASMRQAGRYMMGGNIIDGPALEWLAEQPETVKLWMSDGGITGVGDGWSGDRGLEYCGRILRKGGIQQVRNAAAVMDILTGKKSFSPSKEVNQRHW